jgi:hypothetical protein
MRDMWEKAPWVWKVNPAALIMFEELHFISKVVAIRYVYMSYGCTCTDLTKAYTLSKNPYWFDLKSYWVPAFICVAWASLAVMAETRIVTSTNL